MTPLGWIVFVGWPLASLALAAFGFVGSGTGRNIIGTLGLVSGAAWAVCAWLMAKGLQT